MCRLRAALSAALLVAAHGTQVQAELRPDELAVLAMRDSPQSRELAEYYVQARGLPADRICLLDGVPGADLSRHDWDTTVRPAIRAWLAERGLSSQVRCLVTVWDVPLRIGPADAAAPAARARRDQLAAERPRRVERMAELLAQLSRLLVAEAAADAPAESVPPDVSASDLAQKFQETIRDAMERVTAESDEQKKREAAAALEPTTQQAAGRAGVAQFLQSLMPPEDAAQAAAAAARLEFVRGELQGQRRGLNAILLLPETVERDQLTLELIEQSEGLLGTLAWIDEQSRIAERNESAASFDSELALLDWPAYPLLMWQPNTLHYRFDGDDARRLRPTRMVSRIEAPTFELAKGLIDTAIKVEKTGLDGQCYIDARGFAVLPGQRAPGSYADYDECLRNLAAVLEQHAGQKPTLDNRGELFQPGDCPQAALYCGWYALANYTDAFEWRPGAVAYHIASSEAVTLRDPASNVWCKRMLEDGVCATLGPTFEPYLAAFPRPDEFFPLLLSGRYTLAETYYRTLPFNSWAMTLIGDPLYNPFRALPKIHGASLPPELSRVLGP